jgi:hypothetical protein
MRWLCWYLLGSTSLAYAAPWSARVEGDDLRLEGPPGAAVRLLDATEAEVASGHLDSAGAIVFRGQGRTDPMLRLVDLDGRRASLADLFPAVELLSVLPSKLSAGLEVSPHLRVLERATNRPAAGVEVEVGLACAKQHVVLGHLRSDAHGVAAPPASQPLRVPAELTGSCRLTARAAGAVLEGAVEVTRGAKLVLSTDRPVYQPSDSVHLRGLALDLASGAPMAGASGTLELRDATGAVLARKQVETDRFGLAHATFAVPKALTTANLTVRFALGGETTERALRVGRYVPPAVTVAIRPERASVRAGEAVQITVTASRLDAGPLEGTALELTASDPRGVQLFRARGVADATGTAVLEGTLPPSPVASVNLTARAETPTGDVGHGSATLAVDDGRLALYVIPESGQPVPGATNRFWVVTLAADGSPLSVAVDLEANGSRSSGHTDADGLAFLSLRIPAGTSRVTGTAAHSRRVTVASVRVREGPAILLQVDPPVVSAGGRVEVTVQAPRRTGVALVDLVQGDHPVSSLIVPLLEGRGRATLEVPSHLAGTLLANAWHVDESRQVVADARLLLVEDTRDLLVTLVPDRDSYRPGQEASVAVRVVDGRGQPQIAAVGLVAVDEGLRALGLEYPGLEQAFMRLGPVWDLQAAATPDWAREALFVAKDRRRLAVLAAAVEAKVALAAPQDTKGPRAIAAKAAFRPALQKRAEAIADALTRWYGARRSRKGTRVGLATLTREGTLPGTASHDPWGRTIELQFELPVSCCPNVLQVVSKGVDGLAGTADDLEVSADFHGYTTGGCGCGYRYSGEGHSFGTGEGAGGGGFADFGSIATSGRSEPPIRSNFPETLAVEPSLVTGDDGTAVWRVPLADSLTRWLVQARALSLAGGLGGAETALQVEQPFSVEVSLGGSLTRLDEVEVPLGLTNRSKVARRVEVQIETGGALALVDAGRALTTVEVPAGKSTSLFIRVRAPAVGEGYVEVRARGEGVADAVRRSVVVEADGVPVSEVRSGSVRQEAPAEALLEVPEDGIPGTRQVAVRFYPSAVGAFVEGLESLLRSPSGCFEQTSATTYPNALVLDYLETTRRGSPEIANRARALLDAGWKRLLSFEVPGGGFSWFGNAPANKVLTAFGILEFERMAKVMRVDPAVAKRTRAWLAKERKPDGSYDPDAAYLHAESWGAIQGAAIPVTAYTRL